MYLDHLLMFNSFEIIIGVCMFLNTYNVAFITKVEK